MDIASTLWRCRCIHRSRLLWTKGSIWQLSILKQQVFKRSKVLTFYKSSSKVYKGIYKRNTDPWSSLLQPATKGMVQAKLQHELFRAIVSFVNKSLIKTKSKSNLQIILVRTVIQFVNLLNLKQNYWLKPKKVRRSKIIMYLWNSIINLIIDMLVIISQGKAIMIVY